MNTAARYTTIGYLIADLSRLFGRVFDRRSAHLGLTRVQWRALKRIHQNEGISQAELGSVILPPELRKMTTEVERARLEGLAQLERARGEQAALRSLANAARMLKDNPELMKLRLLQSVGGAKGATLVLGEAALNPAQAAGSTSAGSSS